MSADVPISPKSLQHSMIPRLNVSTQRFTSVMSSSDPLRSSAQFAFNSQELISRSREWIETLQNEVRIETQKNEELSSICEQLKLDLEQEKEACKQAKVSEKLQREKASLLGNTADQAKAAIQSYKTKYKHIKQQNALLIQKCSKLEEELLAAREDSTSSRLRHSKQRSTLILTESDKYDHPSDDNKGLDTGCFERFEPEQNNIDDMVQFDAGHIGHFTRSSRNSMFDLDIPMSAHCRASVSSNHDKHTDNNGTILPSNRDKHIDNNGTILPCNHEKHIDNNGTILPSNYDKHISKHDNNGTTLPSKHDKHNNDKHNYKHDNNGTTLPSNHDKHNNDKHNYKHDNNGTTLPSNHDKHNNDKHNYKHDNNGTTLPSNHDKHNNDKHNYKHDNNGTTLPSNHDKHNDDNHNDDKHNYKHDNNGTTLPSNHDKHGNKHDNNGTTLPSNNDRHNNDKHSNKHDKNTSISCNYPERSACCPRHISAAPYKHQHSRRKHTEAVDQGSEIDHSIHDQLEMMKRAQTEMLMHAKELITQSSNLQDKSKRSIETSTSFRERLISEMECLMKRIETRIDRSKDYIV